MCFLVLIWAPHILQMVACACDPRTPEVGGEGWEIQGHLVCVATWRTAWDTGNSITTLPSKNIKPRKGTQKKKNETVALIPGEQCSPRCFTV